MKLFKAGVIKNHNLGKPGEYKYFLPNTINSTHIIDNAKILTTLEQATKALGELNTYGELAPNIDFFIKMHVLNESVSSSKIEGTQTNIKDALLPEHEISIEKRNDWHEVHNYIKAMNQSINNLSTLPVSIRLLKKAHKQLLSGTRGKHKMPGEIRKSQNWIGGASINSAHFIPPHHQYLANLLSDWEKFWHEQHQLPILIKVALCHYQFETIHPFLDGNGRIGRLFITLQLIEKEFLSKPILYLSTFFEKNKQAYYDSLDRVRQTNNIEQWFLFFLDGIIQTANKAKKTLQEILQLKTQFENDIIQLGIRAKYANQALQYLYTNPIIGIKQLQQYLGIKYDATNNLVKNLVKCNILEEITGYSRNRIFVMRQYLDLFIND